MSTWTTPKTWATDELVTAALLNTHLRDNLSVLKVPPQASHYSLSYAGASTSSSTFVNTDATNLSQTITTKGGRIAICLNGLVYMSGTGRAYFDFSLDGTRLGDSAYGLGSVAIPTTVERFAVEYFFITQTLSAASHTVNVMWLTQAGTIYLDDAVNFHIWEI